MRDDARTRPRAQAAPFIPGLILRALYLPALANFPGVLAVNKKKLKEMMERKGKTTIGLDHFEGPQAG